MNSLQHLNGLNELLVNNNINALEAYQTYTALELILLDLNLDSLTIIRDEAMSSDLYIGYKQLISQTYIDRMFYINALNNISK